MTVYIGIGSNVDPERNIIAALRLLKERVRVIAVSSFYLTEPLGSPGAPRFYNGAIKIETDTNPRELKFGVLRHIEKTLGRTRTEDRYAPRTIDLDILLYGDLVAREPDLMIPDPDIPVRPFLAVPLLELQTDLVLPDSGRRLKDVVDLLPAGSLKPLTEFTRNLREELENER